ncbi:hypothetical protein ACHWQZ_G007698 [Mnemiopsis leidyi]
MASAIVRTCIRQSTRFQSSRRRTIIRAYSHAAKTLVDNGIKENKVFVISKSYCPFCLKAKAILQLAGQKATVEEIEDSPEMDNIQDYCKELTGARSVPRVWINRKFLCRTTRFTIGAASSSTNHSTMAKQLVDSGISDNKVFVISKSYCPFCVKAKDFLNKAGFTDMKVIEIEDMAEMDAIQDYCKTLTGARSVPRVWINQKFIGGGDDVQKAFNNGSLQKLV